MTTENSRADALTDEQHSAIGYAARMLEKFSDGRAAAAIRTLSAMLTAAPSLQPAAAPIYAPALSENELSAILSASLNSYMTTAERDCLRNLMRRVKAANPIVQPAPAPQPSPADERAAFEWPLLPLLPETVITTADGEAVFTAHQMQGYANAYGEMVRVRAASASETGAEGAIPRVPTDTMLRAARDWAVKRMGMGVGNDAATGCWQAMYDAAPRSPAMATEPTACKGKNCGSLDPRFHSAECFEEYEKTVGLKPAQADAQSNKE